MSRMSRMSRPAVRVDEAPCRASFLSRPAVRMDEAPCRASFLSRPAVRLYWVVHGRLGK